MYITKEALRYLAMFNNSCKVFGEKKIKNSRYLVNLALAGKGISFDLFQKKLPQESQMYKSLKGFAGLMGSEEINRKLILDYFSGLNHLIASQEQIDILKLNTKGDNFGEKFIVGHMLLPVTLRSTKYGIVAVYKIGKKEILLENLIAHPFAKETLDSSSQRGYVHFATIIELNPDTDEWEQIAKKQEKLELLKDAISRIKGINYAEFWNLSEWTKENLKICGF